MTDGPRRAPRLPPRWFIRAAWATHRALVRLTGRRLGLRRATADHGGMLRLTTVGRRSGQERQVVLGYLEDGPNLVLMAMNGWADSPPAWWLNLQTHPDARVDLPDGTRSVQAREAVGEERERLWAEMARVTPGDLDAYAALRTRGTPLVILEPLGDTAGG